MKNLFSINAAAAVLERDRGTVTRALRGVAPDSNENKNPRWRLRTVVDALAARERDTGRADTGDLDLSEERAKLARAQTEAAEFKNAIARGEYVRVDEIIKIVERMFSVVREHVLGLHGTVSDECARGDPETRDFISGVIRVKVIEILQNLCDPRTFVHCLEPSPDDTDTPTEETKHE